MKRLFGVVVMISLLMSCKINVQASETDKTLKSNKKEVAGTLKEMVGWKVLLTFYNPVT